MEKNQINYAFKMLGSLRYDNVLFDRTCPACKGMYSSEVRANCPKCNAQLVYLTSGDGKPIAISEGTINLAFGHKQEKRDMDAIANRKNGMVATYRFKLFSFMDEHGILNPPIEHRSCRKGSKVEIVMINHQLIPSWFLNKSGVPKVELMCHVYTNYGDKITMLTEQEYASRVIYHEVNADGSPKSMNTGELAEIDHLKKEIAMLKGQLTSTTTPVVKDVPPWQKQDNVAGASVDDYTVDVFEKA